MASTTPPPTGPVPEAPLRCPGVSSGAPPPAAKQWADLLAAWAIPQEILNAAPESPWGFPPALFAVTDSAADTPSRRRALEELPPGGAVLDVGAGGGAGSIPLVPPAARLVAVDESREMLEAFAARAREAGVDHEEVEGRWPDVASEVPPVDVVVCHHVLYNVAALEPFVAALTRHARRRVVVELTALHPQVPNRPLWQHFHGLEFPEGPSADDALAVLAEMGLDVGVERWERPPRGEEPTEVWVGFVRRRLCLPPEREPEVAEWLRRTGAESRPRSTATLWWAGGADRHR